ncbi:glycosyltransferase [Candidatus Binatia bacterium]|nr:glycosyltransferase [Candidatus Binatia bacterium]
MAAFTGGIHVPSARFRVRQFVAPLRAEGVDVVELPSRAGAYPPSTGRRLVTWAAWNLAARLSDVAGRAARRADVTLLQREFLSTKVTLEPMTRRPRVLDVDDAIWFWGGDAFARRLAGLCERVICGNAFLAEQFASWHGCVEVLPTAVDTDRFVPAGACDRAPSDERPQVLGWSGTRSTLPCLYAIERPLADVLRRYPRAILRVVCDHPPELPLLGERVAFVRWSPEAEVRAIQDMTIGLMPLEDSVVTRGKCSLKMLLYMACGVPVVVSPVGANRDVLACGDSGLAATTPDDWVDAIDSLLRDPDSADRCGARGRAIVEERFSVRALAPRLASLLREVAG